MPNQFEALRLPGNVGTVLSRDYHSILLWQKGSNQAPQSVTVYTGQLCQGAWAFGFQIHDRDKEIKILPGELSGWFRQESDAVLYALEYLRQSDQCPTEARIAALEKIKELTSTSLF